MKIPANILTLLKCSICENYLSCSPVYMQLDGSALCAKCFDPERPAVRNVLYEALAKLMQFPCKNKDYGCEETIPFIVREQDIAHEEVCAYRQLICPLLGPMSCTWLGSRTELLSHCSQQHSQWVLVNSAELSQNITRSSNKTYLVQACKELFLLYVKITVEKINYCVRLIECLDKVKKYNFTLNIKYQSEQLIKEGYADCQASSSVTLDIDSLINVLGCYNDATFIVTIKNIDNNSNVKCSLCEQYIPALCYRGLKGWCCEACAPDKVTCENSECDYKDYLKKCEKHEWYFCTERNRCVRCGRVVDGKLLTHYSSVHGDVLYRAGCLWRATATGGTWCWCLMSSEVGTALCCYWLDKSVFWLRVYLPLTGEQLQQVECKVLLTNRETGNSRIVIADALYDKVYDWEVTIKSNELQCWSLDLDVVVNIS